ncbi:hypothetical protein NEHOM01_2450 [Nematocida homosporus]|uniref:uncharacterized protein n=1 Tax=Nematocida homosporus TaxID=1912981 RepID=UPI002220510A|nr:uncharacterized protein NEHOM01_2450 [Nematocida homosporus]KAI5187926.1 hypothetical protein NEHOM01_2450 [Nematocida homosporus]
MNKRLNEYSLNVYQVVCLVIGLCCVWCSADEDSDKMGLFDISKRLMLDIDSQVESVYDEITNAINKLGILNENQTKQTDLIKQGQQNLKEEKHEASENMNSTQSNCSFSDKSKNLVEQEKIDSISQLVRKEVVQKSIDVIILQLHEWLYECKEIRIQKESRITNIDKPENIVKRLNQIESDLKGLQERFLELKRSGFESGCLITKGAQYHLIGLKVRFVTIMVTELMKIVPKIDISEWIHLTKVMESKIDQFLINDEPESPDNISMIIEEALVWIDGRSKNMEVKSESESEQEPTGSEPSNSRTQLSNPQTNESGMDDKLPSTSKSADQDSTLSFNRYELKLSELDQKDCTPKLDSEQEKLLQKFISSDNQYLLEDEAPPVWRVFNINEDNQSRKYGLSSTSLPAKHTLSLNLDWEESELMELLDVLKKFSKIILKEKYINISNPRGPAGLLVLAQLLTLFESSELNAMKKPLEILVILTDITCPSLESSFTGAMKREQFRNQIEEIEESRYIISMDIYGLTSNVQEFIWPLATHFPTEFIGLYRSQLDKIDFLNDVNWIDQFALKFELDYEKDLIVSLGARTAKGKDLPFCEWLVINTNRPNQGQPSSSRLKVYVIGLTEYLQPNSFDKDGKLLNTSLEVPDDILVFPWP